MGVFRLLFCAIPALVACASMPAGQVMQLSDVQPDEIVVVGKIELVPPLQPSEQDLSSAEGREFRDRFILYFGDSLQPLQPGGVRSFEGAFALPFDREFAIRTPRASKLYLSGGVVYTVYAPPFTIQSILFETPMQVSVRPNDDAVYIGTLQFHRKGSGAVTNLLIRDDYAWAREEFRKQYGSGRALTKSLPVPASGVR